VTTSVPARAAAADNPLLIHPSLAARIVGTIRRPRATFRAILTDPHWADVLILSTLAAAAAGALVMRTDVGQQALVDQWERTAVAFGRELDDTTYARMQALGQQAPLYAVLMAVVNGPVQVFALAGVIWAVWGRRGTATFRQVLAVVSHAGVILALRNIIFAPATYIRETTASATAVGVWFPMFDEASPIARFLGALDLVVLWWAIVLALGVAVLYQLPARRVMVTFAGAYTGLALLLALVMAAAGGQ
jgi:hypothetical protein